MKKKLKKNVSTKNENAVDRTQLETVNEQQNEEGIAWAAREGIFVKSSAVFDQIVQNFDSLFITNAVIWYFLRFIFMILIWFISERYRRENQIYYVLFLTYLIFPAINLYSSADFIYLIVLVLVLYYCISPASTIQNRKCDFERRDITTTSYIFYEVNAI